LLLYQHENAIDFAMDDREFFTKLFVGIFIIGIIAGCCNSEIFLGFVLLIVIALFALAIYFFPCMVARVRDVQGSEVVFFVNLIFGWTLIGWMAAIIMATSMPTKAAVAIEQETLRRLRRQSD
jgi:hypothetical protein